MGNSGNIIYVDPLKNTVISIAALFRPKSKDIIGFIEKEIEPII